MLSVWKSQWFLVASLVTAVLFALLLSPAFQDPALDPSSRLVPSPVLNTSPSLSLSIVPPQPTMASPLADVTNTTPSSAAAAKNDLSAVPTLPVNTTLTYLAEGAANVIYRLSAPSDGPQFTHKLLRLRKALPSAQPNQLAYAQLLNTFHPLFPSHLLLPTSLIRIPPSVLVKENAKLQELEKSEKRPVKRRGLYLEEVNEEFGYLIMDMSPRPLPSPPPSPKSSSPPGFFARALARLPGHRRRVKEPVAAVPAHAHRTRQLLIEFKPKWVVQSLSAPPTWRRCRTCALRLSKDQKHSYCPLDLSSRDEPRVRRAVQYIVPAKQPANLQLSDGETWEATQKTITERIVRYLVDSDLMPSLKKMHSELDPHGPVKIQELGEAEKEKFVMAMTIRDLTIFLRIDLDQKEGEIAGVEAKIGDLDLKTGDAGKWGYWGNVEKKLTEDGWYEGSEEGAEERAIWCAP